MTAHVNEYIPTSKDQTRGIQTDPRRLKFNNIQSCIAVALCVYNPVAHGTPTVNRLIGVHINTLNLRNSEIELNIAISCLSSITTKTGREEFDAYLVGPYDSYYAVSNLSSKLKYLKPRSIKLFNLAPAAVNLGAEKDVKMVASFDAVEVYYRDCVKWENGIAGTEKKLKDKYDPSKGGTAFTTANLQAGHHAYVNDRDQKPWQRVTDFRNLPVV